MKNKNGVIIDIGIYIETQYDNTEKALKNPIDVLKTDIVNADIESNKTNVKTVLTKREAVLSPLSKPEIQADKRMHIKVGPKNSQSSNASFGETFFV